VLKEGFETSVFLLAAAETSHGNRWFAVLGGAVGIGASIALGIALYFGGLKLNLGRFFRVTGAFLVLIAAGLVLGAVIERLVIRPAENKPPLNAIIITIGLLVLLEGLAGVIYGGQFRSFPAAFSIDGLHIGSVALGISANDVFVALAVLAAALLLGAGFRYTSAGLQMRAAAFSPPVARLLGVRVGRMLTLGWALAGLIGALAGVLVSPSTFLYPNSMDSIFVLGFTAAVIGGLDSPAGAVAGGLILGVALSYVGGYLGSDLVNLFGLAALALVLMLRPSGLFSPAATRQV